MEKHATAFTDWTLGYLTALSIDDGVCRQRVCACVCVCSAGTQTGCEGSPRSLSYYLTPTTHKSKNNTFRFATFWYKTPRHMALTVTGNAVLAFMSVCVSLILAPSVLKIFIYLCEETRLAQSVQGLGHETVNWQIVARFPGKTIAFSLSQSSQTDSGAHTALYSVGTGGSFSGVTQIGTLS